MFWLWDAFMTKREAAMWVWEQQLNQPYRWMGNDPNEGFDCSGLVIEGLKAVGLVSRKDDFTSWQLADLWPPALTIQPGVLLFWNRGKRIGHVEIVWQVIDDMVLTIGASGGGSKTDTLQEAIDSDAYVKIRPAGPWDKAVDPFIGGD